MITNSKFLAGCLAAAGLLAGCSTTPAPQYYSLQAAPVVATPVAAKVTSAYAISVQPVVIPQQVSRPQIVVQASAGAEVVPLNAALWAAPLDSQIRNALADALSRRLNVMDVGQSGAADGIPVWRIYVDVQRFDSLYGRAVRHDVVWRVVPQGMPGAVKERVCSAQATQTVGEGMSALVQGHRDALENLSALMAQVLPPATGARKAEAPPTLPEGVSFRGCVG